MNSTKHARATNNEKHAAHSKDNLKRNIETKFRTTMIGALAQFEKFFGDLWGHGKNKEELSKDELDNLKDWELTRTEVLNNGNNQLRAAMTEIDQYNIEYQKYHYQFVPRNRDELVRKS